MEFSTLGAHTRPAWETWYAANVDVTDAGVTVASEDAPTFVEPTALFEVDEDVEAVDVAVDTCGQVYVLHTTGGIAHLDRDGGLIRLGCRWQQEGQPRALAVTRDAVYLARSEPAHVQAYSRELGQTRWLLDDVADPVAFARVGEAVYLLDRGQRPDRGVLRRIHPDGRAETVVTGLHEPIDVASDDDGAVYVLDRQVRAAPDDPDRYLVRVFDADALDGEPVPAADTVWIPPPGFRARGSDEPIVPGCIAVGAAGDLVVGTDPSWDGQQSLARYRPGAVAFERQASFTDGCATLLCPNAAGERRLLVVDGAGQLFELDGLYRTHRSERTGRFDGRVVTRFDAGEAGTRWHRVRLDFDRNGPGTQVEVRYRATDDDHPSPPAVDPSEGGELEDVHGIGPRYARRLRREGIEDLADLARLDGETLATILSVEEVYVPTDEAEGWLAEAKTILEDAADEAGAPRLEAVDGIGPTFATRLRDAGIDDLATLVDLSAEEVSTIVGRDLRDVSPERAAAWIEAAREHLPDAPELDDVDWRPISPPNPRDALLDEAVGRYLWVEIELVGTEFDAPTVRSFDVSFPPRSYLEHLPAIYRSDEGYSTFLERFLALFEGVFTDVEAEIEGIGRYLDPDAVPADSGHLEWLSSWLAADLDDSWPESARREFVARAPELYRMRGTRAGLLETIHLYLDHVDVGRRSSGGREPWDRALEREREQLEALVAAGYLTQAEADGARERHEALASSDNELLVRIVEHADLDCLADGPARVPYSRLISCPQGFLVLLHPALDGEHVRAIERIVDAHCPVHAIGRAVQLRRLAVLGGADESTDRGFHTYLGINATLSPQTFALESSVLGQETILTEREPYGHLGVRARLDEDARVS